MPDFAMLFPSCATQAGNVMKRNTSGSIITALLLGGLLSGCNSHSGPETSESTRPTNEEATAAIRRHKVSLGTFPRATAVLGDCSPSKLTPGVACLTQVVLQPGSAPQTRTVSFARLNGQWEVALW